MQSNKFNNNADLHIQKNRQIISVSSISSDLSISLFFLAVSKLTFSMLVTELLLSIFLTRAFQFTTIFKSKVQVVVHQKAFWSKAMSIN